MVFDFHTHTFLSDGSNSPIELIRFAVSYGYKCIAITDHASYSNIDYLIERLKKDCELAEKYWDIVAVPGVELTNIPAKSINEMAKSAKELGAKLVVVHGESIMEKVEPGTNWEAVNSRYVDILAHPGIFDIDEAKMAKKNDICIEINSRKGHSLTNGIVAKVGEQAGVKFLINSDAHSQNDLIGFDFQKKIGLGAGLELKYVEEIIYKNGRRFLEKLGLKENFSL